MPQFFFPHCKFCLSALKKLYLHLCIQISKMPEGLNAYAQEIVDALEAADVRVELDDRAEKLGYRMREGQVEKVPYLLVVGFNEKDDRTVSFRLHGEKETTVLPLAPASESIIPGLLKKYATTKPPARGTRTPSNAITNEAFPLFFNSSISVSIPAQNIRTTTPISAAS